MLSGDNSILQKATDAKTYSERAEIIENAKLDILAKISEKKGENLTEDELVEILTSADYSTQGELSDEESVLDKTLTSKDKKYTIPVSEIYNGNLTKNTNSDDNLDKLKQYFIGRNINDVYSYGENITLINLEPIMDASTSIQHISFDGQNHYNIVSYGGKYYKIDWVYSDVGRPTYTDVTETTL